MLKIFINVDLSLLENPFHNLVLFMHVEIVMKILLENSPLKNSFIVSNFPLGLFYIKFNIERAEKTCRSL